MLVSESLEGCEWVSRTLFISFCCPHHFVGSSLQFWNSLTYRWLQGTGNIKDVVYLLSWYVPLVEFHTTPMSRPGSLGSRSKASDWECGSRNLQGTWNHHHFHFLGIYAQPPTTGAPFPRLCWLSYRSTASEVPHCDTFWVLQRFQRVKKFGNSFCQSGESMAIGVHTYVSSFVFTIIYIYIYLYMSKVLIYLMVCHMKSNVPCRPCSKQHKEHFRSKINISILKPIFGWS